MGDHELTYTPQGKLYIHKSMIGSYGFCPMQFKKNVLNQQPRKANHAMLVGTRFHEFAFRFYDFCGMVPVDDWLICIPDEFSELEQDMAGWFVEQEQLRYKNIIRSGGSDDDFQPIMRELIMRNEQIGIESTMDRVDWAIRSCQTVCPVEYKTGNKIREENILDELAFYGILFETTTGFSVTEYRIINPKLKYNETFPYNERVVKKVLKQIIKLRQALDDNNFPYKCTEAKFAACKICNPGEVLPEGMNINQMAEYIINKLDYETDQTPMSQPGDV